MPYSTDLETLRRKLPEAAFPVIAHWLRSEPVLVRISPSRSTKLGDFRTASRTLPHRISVNADLNRYAFLVTLVHEFAHYHTFINNRRWVKPHGLQWKREYEQAMRPFLTRRVFPADLLFALRIHMADAPASSCSDQELMRVLRKYDQSPGTYLDEIPVRSVFRFNQRLFVKGPQLRKRFKCRCLNDRRNYFIDPMAEVHVERAIATKRAS